MTEERKRLMALLGTAHNIACDAKLFENATYAKQLEEEADYLLDNGVRLEAEQETSDKASKVVEIDQFNKWIPVTERLPEHGKVVLVYGKRGAIYTAWCNSLYKNPGWHKLNSKNHYCDPTHWMPLPEPPKE